MAMRRYDVDVTTDGAGAATAYSPAVRGGVQTIQYIKDTVAAGANAFATGVDWVITDETTGEALWTGTDVNASIIIRPRANTHDTAGVARLYVAAGTNVPDTIGISGRIKIVVAQGGAAKVGKFRFIIG